MDIEFHFYITYIIAKKAGFKKDEAYIIAYSSQYVDDNDTVYTIEKNSDNEYSNYISQTKDIFKPQEEIMRIYPAFHFMPGTYGEIANDSARRRDGKLHLMNTIPDNENSRRLLDAALNSYNLYRIGIATHMYSDTFAHQNFVGFKDTFNDIKGFLETFIPSIGHADAKFQPDTPGLLWKDERLVPSHLHVNNKKRFLKALKAIYEKYTTYLHTPMNDEHEQIFDAIGNAMDEYSREERIKSYKTLAGDDIEYDEHEWIDNAIEYTHDLDSIVSINGSIEMDKTGYLWKKHYKSSHWYQFQEAVKAHQRLAMDMVLRSIFAKMEYIGL